MRFEHQKLFKDKNAEIEAEQEKLRKALLRHKEAKDLWHRVDGENADRLRFLESNVERLDKQKGTLTSNLKHAMEQLHTIQHSQHTQEVEVNVLTAELEEARAIIAHLDSRDRKDVKRGGGGGGGTTTRSEAHQRQRTRARRGSASAISARATARSRVWRSANPMLRLGG